MAFSCFSVLFLLIFLFKQEFRPNLSALCQRLLVNFLFTTIKSGIFFLSRFEWLIRDRKGRLRSFKDGTPQLHFSHLIEFITVASECYLFRFRCLTKQIPFLPGLRLPMLDPQNRAVSFLLAAKNRIT